MNRNEVKVMLIAKFGNYTEQMISNLFVWDVVNGNAMKAELFMERRNIFISLVRKSEGGPKDCEFFTRQEGIRDAVARINSLVY
jgi:hypothetical protein